MFVRFNIISKVGEFELNIAGEFKDGITGIFGPSGSGKTTLLKCLSGVITPDNGKIMVNEQVCYSSDKEQSLPLEERRIGMVWQDTLLFPHMTVEENILYGRREDNRQSFIASVIDIFEIRRLLNRMPANLSGGEKQRVAIVRALLPEPQLLLFDEPVASLDMRSRQKIISYLKSVNEQHKIPICYVSHSVSELMFLCQEVMVIEDGRRVRFDSPEKVFINEKQLALMDEDFENILELPVKNMRREEQVAELDLGGVILKAVYHTAENPPLLKVGIRAKDILIATEKIKGISARNILSAIIEKVERTGDMVLVSCRVGERQLWVEITPGSFRELNLHISQIVYLIIKARSITVLD
ncbi:MAG: molybdenum ABC transporter ATP-binding protein [Candidatus Omnitrophica bacterium]|nr:molybdenum ABC transporter ATP-binding protein [Candidatus Omnitrophota bacterium]